MLGRDLVVVGASAGGVEALKSLVANLPPDFAAAVVVVLHVAPSATSALPAILSRNGPLPAHHVQDGAAIEPGHIYVAPPDHHVLIHDGSLRLSRGPRVNGHRPAIDPLFLSAARWRGERVMSVVLSGVLEDGTNGSCAIRARGGVTFAQTPDTALHPTMPLSAIESGGIVHVLPVEEIATQLARLATEELPEPTPRPGLTKANDIEHELDIDPEGSAAVRGPASGYTCPDCHGALWEVKDSPAGRYRCRVGHSYGPDSLLVLQSDKIEEALWAGYRALEESAALSKRLADRAVARGASQMAKRYGARSRDALERAKMLRELLERGQLGVAEPESR